MKKAHFGISCPSCGPGTMVATALFNKEEQQFFMFYITSEGNIGVDGICSHCQGQFQGTFSLMGLLSQCPDEDDKIVPNKTEHLHIFKKLTVF